MFGDRMNAARQARVQERLKKAQATKDATKERVNAERQAVRQNTARLKGLRLEQEAERKAEAGSEPVQEADESGERDLTPRA